MEKPEVGTEEVPVLPEVVGGSSND